MALDRRSAVPGEEVRLVVAISKIATRPSLVLIPGSTQVVVIPGSEGQIWQLVATPMLRGCSRAIRYSQRLADNSVIASVGANVTIIERL